MVDRYQRTLNFEYKNYKGKVGIRHVIPVEVWYGETEFHIGNQWFMKAYDYDKKETRDFAIKDIIRYV